ncbi:MAG: hypothetical protein WCJ64_15745 [Rhodospirillaceae bacterium]
MRRGRPNDRELRDAFDVTATFSLIIVSSLIHLAATTLLIGVFIVGFLMIFDHNYLPLFDQWVVAVILYVVYRITVLTRRTKAEPTLMVVMMSSGSGFDAGFATGFETEGGFAPRGMPRPLPTLAGADHLHLPMIGHSR